MATKTSAQILKKCTIRKLQKLEIVDLSTIAQEVRGSYSTEKPILNYLVYCYHGKARNKVQNLVSTV